MTILPSDNRTTAVTASEDWRWFILVVRRALLFVVREIERKYGVKE